jgi:putative flippase GtrA
MAVIDLSEEESLAREATRQRPPRFSAITPSPTADDGIAAITSDALTVAEPQPAVYDRLYQWVDQKSNGKGAEIIRLGQFLLVGGSASVLNLICVALLDHSFHPTSALAVFLVTLVATEISLLYNFALNDRFTFRSLIGEHRTMLQRCIRFHGPASVGFILTLTISNGIHHFVTIRGQHLSLVVGQAIAIVIVTAVNFFMHRHWTYREVKVTA